ncbi:MAG: WD40 repeat domain-containing protein, partial [Nonomuraea sp.]|nr:WD40 repeat domain-containing protein [Nonomuraea sp.]
LTNTVLAWDRESLGVDGVDEVTLSGDGRVALAVGHDRAQVVTLASGRTRPLGERKALVRVSALSPDGRTALVGEDGGATTVWDLDDPGHPVRRGTFHGRATALTLTGDGRTAAVGGSDGTMTVWDLTDRAHPVRRSVTEIAEGRTEDLAMSADGRTAVTANEDGPVTVWNLADRARPARIGALSPSIHTATALALSADGRTLVVGRLERGAEWKSQAAIWNLADPVGPTTAAFIEPSDGEVAGAALSSDGKTALLVGEYGGVSLWDLSTPSEPVRPAGLPRLSAGGTVALSADAGIALTTEAGGLVSRWDLGRLHDVAADPARGLCEHGGQSMSRADWDRFTGGAKPSDYGESDELDFVFLCGLGSR